MGRRINFQIIPAAGAAEFYYLGEMVAGGAGSLRHRPRSCNVERKSATTVQQRFFFDMKPPNHRGTTTGAEYDDTAKINIR